MINVSNFNIIWKNSLDPGDKASEAMTEAAQTDKELVKKRYLKLT